MTDDLFLLRYTLIAGRNIPYAVVCCSCDGGHRMAAVYLYETVSTMFSFAQAYCRSSSDANGMVHTFLQYVLL